MQAPSDVQKYTYRQVSVSNVTNPCLRRPAKVKLSPDTFMTRSLLPRFWAGVMLLAGAFSVGAATDPALIDAVKRWRRQRRPRASGQEGRRERPCRGQLHGARLGRSGQQPGDGQPADRRGRERERRDALQDHAAVAGMYERKCRHHRASAEGGRGCQQHFGRRPDRADDGCAERQRGRDQNAADAMARR